MGIERTYLRKCRWQWSLCLLVIVVTGCSSIKNGENTALVQVNTLDQNGFSEVVTSSEKLSVLRGRDFVADLQPYQKVSRLYKTPKGDLKGVLTSYYPSGQIHQYLETVGAHAKGICRQWHPNGKLKIEARVVGGKADLDRHSECSWVFHGLTSAWNEKGLLEAEISYDKGQLSGLASYYFPNGALKRLERYDNNKLFGKGLDFFQTGELFKEESFENGLLNGESHYFSVEGGRIAIESWSSNKLESGSYFSCEGKKIGSVEKGYGTAIYTLRDKTQEHRKVIGGTVCEILSYNTNGSCQHSCELLNGEPHGIERIFFPEGNIQTEITWQNACVHGEQKSWYPSGQLESLRLMENNRRHGLCTAWYESGEVMLIEEYDQDSLHDGQYFRKGEDFPVSRVKNGSGTATLFNGKGALVKRITYEKGAPSLKR